jgi:CBS domain containing-hemolysin-like protein/mannitol/fructose-specific phosphotransferase system IIA component (Ntr-type)
MNWLTILYLLMALLLAILNGFFVMAEFALVKVRSSRVEELARQGGHRAMIVREMVANLDKYLSATQLGITVASLGLGWLGEPAFAGLIEAIISLPGWLSKAASTSISIGVAFLLITFLHIVVGELAPKSVAIRRSEQCALAIAYPMRWAFALFYLPMIVLNGVSNLLLRLFGLQVAYPELAHTQQELRILLFTAQTGRDFSLHRLLMLENIFDLGHQTVKDVMVPWTRVQYLSRSATRTEVLQALAQHRFSRWPVLDTDTHAPVGYLLMKDMIAQPGEDAIWPDRIRPLQVVSPQDRLEATMQALQGDGANMAIVMDRGTAVGLITLEDILEEIVGKIEDEFPRLPRLYLKDALESGGVVLELAAQSPEEAIRNLVAAISPENLPRGCDVTAAALARERRITSDIGQGVAIAAARCQELAKPLIVAGRSAEGVRFGAHSIEPSRLVFLVITPAERPNAQVFLSAQLTNVVESEFIRERLYRTGSTQEFIEIIAAADPEGRKERQRLEKDDRTEREDRWADDGGQR